MIDYFLKFSSKEEAESVLFDKTDDGLVLRFQGTIAVVGKVYETTGKITKGVDGDVPEMLAVAGWHVNYRGEEAESLAKYQVFPTTPVQGWA
jgi:hypothetical protein